MHYCYVKKESQTREHAVNSKFLSIFLSLVGFILIGSAAGPIFFYQFFVSPKFSEMIKPIPQEQVLGEKNVEEVDFTKVSNWFPTAPKLPPLPSKITHYTLTIPKLKIAEAVVQIGGEDLKKSLIQYEGTAFPGQFGNTVVFGHSVLPQFYNPKNYLTIFSTLPTLKVKDEILVDFDGVKYKYMIEQMTEVKKEDISVLEQKYDDSYLTLITCVPPGTYLRRLVVRTRLVKI
ncbi:MAG: sortase [Patescibacteria group bacterium]